MVFQTWNHGKKKEKRKAVLLLAYFYMSAIYIRTQRLTGAMNVIKSTQIQEINHLTFQL